MNPRNNSNSINETIFVTTKKVSCNGSRGSSIEEGHPLVYLNIGKNGSVTCPYCSKLFTTNKNPSQVIIGLKNQNL